LNGPISESLRIDVPESPDADGWVLVARVVRPQGRHGEVLADLLTDFPERFAERKRLFLTAPNWAPRPIELEKQWLHQGRIVLKFAGIDSINDAETLRGLEVSIPKSERAPLEDGAVYISDLVGCVLVDSRTGAEVGRITDVDREASATPLLVVESSSGEVLVPFAKAFQPKIDLDARRIEMQLPEGLLDLNAPGGSAGI
jgi:16S rRNA processing protein RimM